MGNQCCSGDDNRGQQVTHSQVQLPGDYAEPTAKVLLVQFKTPEGLQEVTFSNRPLGLLFNKTNPIEVKGFAVGSEGEKLGVKAGWLIHGVDGEDVTKKDFDYTCNTLRKIASQLPE